MNPHRAKILIVEDNQPTRLLLRNLMHNLGVVTLDVAPDGKAALELIERNHYDLVLADWNMPCLSGIQLVRIIRQMPVAKVPVILISCDVSPRRAREALEAGVSGLVAKPFVNVDLCNKVLRILSALAPVSDSIYAPPVDLIDLTA